MGVFVRAHVVTCLLANESIYANDKHHYPFLSLKKVFILDLSTLTCMIRFRVALKGEECGGISEVIRSRAPTCGLTNAPTPLNQIG